MWSNVITAKKKLCKFYFEYNKKSVTNKQTDYFRWMYEDLLRLENNIQFRGPVKPVSVSKYIYIYMLVWIVVLSYVYILSLMFIVFVIDVVVDTSYFSVSLSLFLPVYFVFNKAQIILKSILCKTTHSSEWNTKQCLFSYFIYLYIYVQYIPYYDYLLKAVGGRCNWSSSTAYFDLAEWI